LKRFYIFIFLLISISVHAQQGMFIEGKVVDQQNKPIPSANIKIIETNQYGITAPDGSFKLPVKNLSAKPGQHCFKGIKFKFRNDRY